MTQCRLVLALVLALWLCACSGPKGPVQGSPGWLYQAARDSYVAGDWEKATDHLRKIERAGSNPFVQRAQTWRALVSAGMAAGHLEVAQAYADGSISARTNKNAFLRQKSEHLKEARRHTISLLEALDGLAKGGTDKPLLLEFPFPKGSAGQVPELDRVYKGMPVDNATSAAAAEKTVSRGIVRAVSSVLTSPDDSAGAQKALQAGKAEVPPAKFLLAMAGNMDKLSPIFDRKGLNESEELKVLQERTLDATKRVLDLKPDATMETAAKKLQENIEKARKAPGPRVVSKKR